MRYAVLSFRFFFTKLSPTYPVTGDTKKEHSYNNLGKPPPIQNIKREKASIMIGGTFSNLQFAVYNFYTPTIPKFFPACCLVDTRKGSLLPSNHQDTDWGAE